jgi:hypothetical protein
MMMKMMNGSGYDYGSELSDVKKKKWNVVEDGPCQL